MGSNWQTLWLIFVCLHIINVGVSLGSQLDLEAVESRQTGVKVTPKNAQLQKRALGSEELKDLKAEETIHAGHHGKGKYFMYAHQPDKKQYEFGFKRGNDHHTVERYEKGGPHHNFKTKVRWHDSKGGHGEHYWDYNHAPKYHDDHHDDHGHGHGDGYDHHGGYSDHHGHSDHHGGYDHGHHDHGGYHSQPIPDYAALGSNPNPEVDADSFRQRRKTAKKSTEKMDKELENEYLQDSGPNKSGNFEDTSKIIEAPSAFPSMLGYNPYEPPEMFQSQHQSKITKPDDKKKSQSPKKVPSLSKKLKAPPKFDIKKVPEKQVQDNKPVVPKLAYDLETGRVYDEDKNVWYKLVASN